MISDEHAPTVRSDGRQRQHMKFVSVMTSESPGGGEFAAVNMLEALTQRGHDAVLLTNQPSIAGGRNVRAEHIDLGPKLSRSSYGHLVPRWPRLLNTLRHALDREAPYDVLVLHFKKEQLLGPLLPKRLRPRLVWAEWGPVPAQMSRGPGRWAYVAAARRADLIFAVSAGTRDSLQAVGISGHRVHIVPNALPIETAEFSAEGRRRVRAECGIPDDALVVGCVSRFHGKKPNAVAVDAVVALGRDDVHLMMAGEGEDEANLRRHAGPLGVRAHFLPTPGTEIASVCSAFDVSVFCPSPTEGTPLAVIHSMLAGRPCLSTGDEGVAGLIVPGAGTIVHPEHDARALARVLQVYLDDAPRREREGAAGREIAKSTFAAPSVAARIESLLERPVTG
jgi:glycosyltransferase involved in cell wall biosynthesis